MRSLYVTAAYMKNCEILVRVLQIANVSSMKQRYGRILITNAMPPSEFLLLANFFFIFLFFKRNL